MFKKLKRDYQVRKCINTLEACRFKNNECICELEQVNLLFKSNAILNIALEKDIREIENIIYIGRQLENRICQLLYSLRNNEFRFISSQIKMVEAEQSRFNESVCVMNMKIKLLNTCFNG